jgi:hypothetical protein
MVIPDHLFLKRYTNVPTGDVVYLHILGMGLVFLNSMEAAGDLMDRERIYLL